LTAADTGLSFAQTLIAGAVGGGVTGVFAVGVSLLAQRFEGERESRRWRYAEESRIRGSLLELVAAANQALVPLARLRQALKQHRPPPADLVASLEVGVARFREARSHLVFDDPLVATESGDVDDKLTHLLVWSLYLRDSPERSQHDDEEALADAEAIAAAGTRMVVAARALLAQYHSG
jgi:hypothetical protein